MSEFLKVSFHCHFADGGLSKHYQEVRPEDLYKWAECYKFTHPNCKAVTIQIVFRDEPKEPKEE